MPYYVNNKIYGHYIKTYFDVSSTQMANHRIMEDVFFRIPLNESGGIGMLGRVKLSAFTELLPCTCSSADCRFSSWMPLNDSAEHLRDQKIHYIRTFTKYEFVHITTQ
jgi:hypothetical protein